MNLEPDVVVIGAGPSGAIAACLLANKGYSVTILEKLIFPRFVIGESLLPQCLSVLEEADCLSAIKKYGFQKKVGATFKLGDKYSKIVFNEKFTAGPGYAFHVQRAEFDAELIKCAKEKGADIHFECEVTQIKNMLNASQVTYLDKTGQENNINCRFILDASGYGRVLPRLLSIDQPSSLPPRASIFSHVKDNISDGEHARDETLITIHEAHKDIWYWLISFSNGRSSVGAVGNPEYLKKFQDAGLDGLKGIVNEDKILGNILRNAEYDTPVMQINAYSGSVSQLYGDGFAVLGNAGEFLDPVFSSGVTVAIQSSSLAVKTLDKTLQGLSPDWQREFADPLNIGIETFKCYVNSWYEGGFQKVIFTQSNSHNVKQMIASILAGYAWDEKNPYVAQPQKRLNALIELCQD